jgi:hypothetical protein
MLLKLKVRFGLVVFALSILGCVATQEGVAIVGTPTTRYGSIHLYSCHKNLESSPKGSPEKCNKQLIIIGKASAFREFESADYSKFYKHYLELANLINPEGEPSLSFEQFSQEFAGWTRLKWKEIVLAGDFYEDALVTKKLRWVIDFPSSTATILYQGEGDLVLARSNPDGFFVIESVLCREDQDSGRGNCGHPQGIFDAETGSEVDHNLEPVSGGKQIFVERYSPQVD